MELPYALGADARGALIDAYRARGILGVAKRVSFLVGADGRIVRTYAKVSPAGHAAEVLRDVEAVTAG